jgi:hypothetical protein
MENLNIIKILSYGISGLAFLLIFMTYSLILKEQRRERPRREIMRMIRSFMILELLCIGVVGFFGVPTFQDNLFLHQTNDTLKVENYKTKSLVDFEKNSDILEKEGENLSQDSITSLIQENADNLDSLSQMVSKVNPKQEKKINQIKENLHEKIDKLTNAKKKLSSKELRRVVKEMQTLQKDLDETVKENQ